MYVCDQYCKIYLCVALFQDLPYTGLLAKIVAIARGILNAAVGFCNSYIYCATIINIHHLYVKKKQFLGIQHLKILIGCQ